MIHLDTFLVNCTQNYTVLQINYGANNVIEKDGSFNFLQLLNARLCSGK